MRLPATATVRVLVTARENLVTTSLFANKHQYLFYITYVRASDIGLTPLYDPLLLMVGDSFTPLPASKLGEYTVIKDIAEGTFGIVKSTAITWCQRLKAHFVPLQWPSIQLPDIV